jgi:enoyl-CoA hydratase/carnithine racemase
MERTGGTATIDLGDGPSQFDGVLVPELLGALDEVEADGDVTMLVTTGRGKHYSNGYDLPYLGSLAQDEATAFLRRSVEVLARLLTFPVPTAAAINGHAFGIGAMLALAHDRRAMRADRGWFCLPEIDLGLRFLPFQMRLVTSRLPVATAREAIMSGRRYTATEAAEAGIVHAVAPEDGLVEAAVALAEPWAGRDRAVVKALKGDLEAELLALLDA